MSARPSGDLKLARRWLAFAQEDLRVLPVLIDEAAYGLACFHAQQAAEKALKAIIANRDARIPKVHYLAELYQSAKSVFPKASELEDAVHLLDRYYTPTRYPDVLPGSLPSGLPERADAVEAHRLARQFIAIAEQILQD